MTKPIVLFFARGYQADFFPILQSGEYQAIFATLTAAERKRVERRGGQVVACFEEDYERLIASAVTENYLITSFMSDRFLGRFSYAKRLEVLGKEIAFWSRLLDTYRPAAVVNELVAIEISEVLFIECERRGIRYLAPMYCPVDGYFYWIPKPNNISGRYFVLPSPSESSRQMARDYVKKLLAKDFRPFYVKNLRSRRNVSALLVALVKMFLWKVRSLLCAVSGRFRYELYYEEYAKRVAVYFKSLFLRYDSLTDLPADKEVIFYPLHQEPEATLYYMSEFYANQSATIENILRCLSVNQVLVVKEHPVDKGSLLRQKFQGLRKQCSGLYFLPAELHSREVLTVASRVVTLTSTVGWESAAIGKRTYVLGRVFYDCLNGVCAVGSFEELKRELRAEASYGNVEVAAVEEFVAGITELSYPGNPLPNKHLYTQKNKEHVVHAIAHTIGL